MPRTANLAPVLTNRMTNQVRPQPIPKVTVVMSPRERFSLTERSITSLFGDLSVPFDFICVDGGSPASVRDYLQREATRRSFRLIRTDYYLTPNEARNLATEQVRTRYVVFIDNDVVVAPGWLGNLLCCAEETNADIVAPLTCIGEPIHARVHMAGGEAHVREENGRRVFRESHYFADRPVAEVRDKLVRGPCELAEFHCMLTRKSVLDRLGPLDENLKAVAEHTDFCLTVRGAGGAVIFEPNALVTYVVGPPLALSDIPYFYCRWSDDWAVNSERYFHEKWGTLFNEDVFRQFVVPHRRHALPRLRRFVRTLVGWRISEFLFDRLARLVTWWPMRRRERLLTPASRAVPNQSIVAGHQ
jgi:GT2 family glycosyltransferase